MDDLVLLEAIGLYKKFGGLEAVKNLNLKIREGELRAIIGPNGAGKTTLVNIISGRTRPTSGRVIFRGRDITNLPPHKRAKMGIIYTYQLINIYRNLTVYENISLAAQRRLLDSISSLIALDEDKLHSIVDGVIKRIGLEDYRDVEASSLPYGYQRLLEVGIALALCPQLLILDEPMQGLTIGEIETMKDLIREIRREKTILLIEHNMQVVMELAENITVMDKGAVIAEGPPEEIEGNIQVQRVYLGI